MWLFGYRPLMTTLGNRYTDGIFRVETMRNTIMGAGDIIIYEKDLICCAW